MKAIYKIEFFFISGCQEITSLESEDSIFILTNNAVWTNWKNNHMKKTLEVGILILHIRVSKI